MLVFNVYVNGKEAVKRGFACDGRTEVKLTDEHLKELSQEQRNILASMVGSNCFTINEPTAKGILEYVEERRLQEEAKQAERAALEEAAAKAVSSKTLEEIQQIVADQQTRSEEVFPTPEGMSGFAFHTQVSNLIEKIDGSSKLLKERRAEELARKEQEAADKRVAAQARQQEIENWIRQHGSERLQRMLKEELPVNTVYHEERLAMDRPGWKFYSNVLGSTSDPINPPMKAFELLDEARKVDPESYLQYYTEGWTDDDEDEWYEDRPKHKVAKYVAESFFLGERVVYGV